MSPVPLRSGGGLNRFPPGRIEVEQRAARRAAIARARKGATTEVIGGRPFTVLRLEDAPGGDYPVPDESVPLEVGDTVGSDVCGCMRVSQPATERTAP